MKIGKIRVILTLLTVHIGHKIDSLVSFLGETRREMLSRPISSREFDISKVSSFLDKDIPVSNWSRFSTFEYSKSRIVSRRTSFLSRFLSRYLSRLDSSVSSRLVSAKTRLDPSLNLTSKYG